MGGDNSFYLVIINNLTRGHSLYKNPNMGAPNGQILYDFPAVGDLINYGYLRLLALVTRRTALTETLFYFTTYFSAAIAAQLTARRIGMRKSTSIVIGVLFAFLPYHLIKNVQHLMLSSYFALPLIVFALVEILKPRPELTARHRNLVLITLGVLAGGTGIYYAIFSFFTVVSTLVVHALNRSINKRTLHRLSIYISGLFFSVIVSAIPSVTYGIKNGFRNFERSFLEVEYYGLKIANLFRPIEAHRLSLFRQFSKSFAPTMIPGEPVEMLGLLGSLGLFLLLLFVLRQIVTSSRRTNFVSPETEHSLIALVAVVAIFFSTVGSINSILYVSGLNQIRVWSRITPLIAFCALSFGGMMVEKIRMRKKHFAYFLLIPVLSIGLLDQTSPQYVPQYQENAEIWNREESFTRAADKAFARNSMIYQMPNIEFPENGPVLGMEDYAQSFPFIHGSHLRWSYGQTKTRTSEFHQNSRTLSGKELLKYLRKNGFAGVHLTRRGIQDQGQQFIDLVIQLGGNIVTQSTDNQEVLLDIRNLKEEK
jgi:phosphoglycerol transferase